MTRIRQSPGIELHEIDRSQYDDSIDNSTVGTTTLVMGFSDKGENYDVKQINSIQSLQQAYGTPTIGQEAETYFYNACTTVLNGGGRLLAAKLPYDNNSLDRYAYVKYDVSGVPSSLSSIVDCIDRNPESSPVTLVKAVAFDNDTFHRDGIDDHQYPMAYDIADFVYDNIVVGFEEEPDFRRTFDGTVKSLSVMSGLFRDIGGYESIQNSVIQMRSRFGSFEKLIKEFIGGITSDRFSEYYHDYTEILENHLTDRVISSFFAVTSAFYDSCADMVCNEKFIDIRQADGSVKNYITISNSAESNGLMTMDQYDKLLVDDINVEKNTIRIVDVSRSNLESDDYGHEIYGIMPVITTPVNAIYFQNLIDNGSTKVLDYTVLLSAVQCSGFDGVPGFGFDGNTSSEDFAGTYIPLGGENGAGITKRTSTVTTNAVDMFPILKNKNGHFDAVDLKTVGLVVFKVFRDSANADKVGFLPVESYTGTLTRNQIDPITGRKMFLEDVVNQKSRLVNVFVNVDRDLVDNVSTIALGGQYGTILGFNKADTVKQISVKTSILDAMDKVLERCKDIHTVQIDIVLDAGVSTIGQYIASAYDGGHVATTTQFIKTEPRPECGCPTYSVSTRYGYRAGSFDIYGDMSSAFKLNSQNDVIVWSTILGKFDNFCKNTRKDCIFLADAPRSFCLEGDQPIVRRTRPDRTVQNTILPKLKYITGVLNSSYSAGYCNWVSVQDAFTSDLFWCPPSIKAAQVMLFTDTYANYWNAPAGLNRGVLQQTYDVAFSPTDRETWDIYQASWNYALSYPLYGVVLEGQKTFQQDKTALDRINVRRLLLGLEKFTRYVSRHFNYEQNTEWNRERLVERLGDYYDTVRNDYGLSEYVIICDERNNTPMTIDNHELHLTIAVKPIKAIEFIILNFICTNQSADVSEIANEYVM